MSVEALREFCNEMCLKSIGIGVAVSGADESYRYVIARRDGEIIQTVKNANEALSGRGGGKGSMATGTFSQSLEKIKKGMIYLIQYFMKDINRY